MSKKQVKALGGLVFNVDTSDESCGKFGFKHGDKIVNCNGHTGFVEGTAPAIEGIDPEPIVLWYTLNDNEGNSSYMYPLESGDLRPA